MAAKPGQGVGRRGPIGPALRYLLLEEPGGGGGRRRRRRRRPEAAAAVAQMSGLGPVFREAARRGAGLAVLRHLHEQVGVCEMKADSVALSNR